MRLVEGDDSYPCGSHVEVTADELAQLRAAIKSEESIEQLVGPEIMSALKKQPLLPVEYRLWTPGFPIYLDEKCRCNRRQAERRDDQLSMEVGIER